MESPARRSLSISFCINEVVVQRGLALFNANVTLLKYWTVSNQWPKFHFERGCSQLQHSRKTTRHGLNNAFVGSLLTRTNQMIIVLVFGRSMDCDIQRRLRNVGFEAKIGIVETSQHENYRNFFFFASSSSVIAPEWANWPKSPTEDDPGNRNKSFWHENHPDEQTVGG